MKALVQKKTEAELLESHPIRGKTPGWFFQATEVSNGCLIIEGTDAFGRLVSRGGSDYDQLLADCEIDAAKITRLTDEN